jgi:hypothetical protein
MDQKNDDQPRVRPTLSAQAVADMAARRDREAAALRANLRRRKEQARAREQQRPEGKPDDAPTDDNVSR